MIIEKMMNKVKDIWQVKAHKRTVQQKKILPEEENSKSLPNLMLQNLKNRLLLKKVTSKKMCNTWKTN